MNLINDYATLWVKKRLNYLIIADEVPALREHPSLMHLELIKWWNAWVWHQTPKGPQCAIWTIMQSSSPLWPNSKVALMHTISKENGPEASIKNWLNNLAPKLEIRLSSQPYYKDRQFWSKSSYSINFILTWVDL